MADTSSAPAEGTPVWIEIFAGDVDRARKFYSAVFNWTFTEIPDTPKEETIMFSFPATSVKYHGGSVTRADESQRKRGVKATKMYLYMNDLKGTMEKIVANGGKEVSDVEPEGDHGYIMRFEDCEGNLMGLYSHTA